MRFRRFLPLLLIAAVAVPTAALAQESKLVIGGTTYTKWLWGNQRDDGSLYNFTTVPGEGYGDNGQGSEVELLLNAKLSKQVEVKARIHSRFSQNQWTNFGGFGGSRRPAQDAGLRVQSGRHGEDARRPDDGPQVDRETQQLPRRRGQIDAIP